MYEKNKKALIDRVCISYINKIEEIDKLEVTENEIKTYEGKVLFAYNGNFYHLTSKYIKKEYENYLQNIVKNRDNLIFIFGIGNLHLLRSLLKDSTYLTRFVIIEPNKYVFKYMLSNYDIVDIINDERILIFQEDELDEDFDLLLRFYSQDCWENYVHNIQVLALPNYYMYREFMIKVVKNVTNRCKASIITLGNSLEDNFWGLRNCYKNLEGSFESNSIKEIEGKFKGYPAIIVSAGPSLDKNIQFLKEAQDKALIITCDASWKACNQYGVKPDAIASIERVEATYQYYYEGKAFPENLVLLGPDLLYPDIIGKFQGKKIISTKMNGGLDGWWADFFENINHVDQGMTCAGTAFSYARIAGCNPIILMGQDLAFTENRIHGNLAHTEYEGENKAPQIEADEIWVEDVYGEQVKTNQTYNMFRDWFECQIALYSELKVIDATEGGAKIAGSTISTLKEAIDTYCTQKMPYHIYDCLEDVSVSIEDKMIKCDEIIKDAKGIIRLLKKIHKMSETYYYTLDKLLNKDIISMSQEELEKVLDKLKKGDEIIQFIMEQNATLLFFQAIIKETIIYVRKIGNERTAENVKRNVALQGNLMAMITNTCLHTKEEYQELIEYVERYKAELV